ncbi:hypothetical protein LSH36_171g05014 [Paralvinella palmiformis]|uniref:Calpain catalytic domain-containing protein n=1 Tax=Paralvinella palmiformis TaxID=53620 RepID=A0AAD9N7Z7_9ANNE|nr:hypothetical protein LSH36_171g05014 [Paralvinella palmiformis]
MGSTEYQKLKADLLKEGSLYIDPSFQALPRSLYYSKYNQHIRWRRPFEICKHPKFVVEKATRFDLDQGALGDCWYIAAAATLATRPELFHRVVPVDQSFDDDYVGLFRFNFWRYGKWVEVIIDDKLPVVGNKLYFCSNREEPDEFWSALLEKAYAKLHGCYESLEGGWMEDGLVDFSGGIGHRIDLDKTRNKLPKDFFDTMLHFQNKNSMMGSCIFSTRNTMENVLDNGLVVGHAYSVTKFMRCLIGNKYEELVRLRNPWGKTEWNGAWSDSSTEWRSLDTKTREKIGLVNEEDDLYWTNPQYSITISPKHGSQRDTKSWMVISLMQKYSRTLRTYAKSEETHVPISFDLYKPVRDPRELQDRQKRINDVVIYGVSESTSDDNTIRKNHDEILGTQIPNMLDLIITIEEGMISQMVLSSPIGKRHYVCIDFMFNCYTPEQPSQKPKQIFHKGDYDAMRTDTQTMT